MPLQAKKLKKISQDPFLLDIELKKTPRFLKEVDENGETILHHISRIKNEFIAAVSLHAITRYADCKEFDLSIQNKKGQTALHTALADYANRATYIYIIPGFLLCAARNPKILDILDSTGFSIYHYAVTHIGACKIVHKPSTIFHEFIDIRQHYLSQIINARVKKPNWNCLSREGRTPMALALTIENFDELARLLENQDALTAAKKDPYLRQLLQNKIISLHQEIASIERLFTKNKKTLIILNEAKNSYTECHQLFEKIYGVRFSGLALEHKSHPILPKSQSLPTLR